MLFISSKKLFLFSRYLIFRNFLSFLSTVSRSRRSCKTAVSMTSWTGLHKLGNEISRITQKPFCIKSSKLLRWQIVKLINFCKHVLLPKKRLVTGSRLPIFFMIWYIKETWPQRKKSSELFKGFLKILFQNILFLKSFFNALVVLDYLPKLKKWSGSSFWCTFSAHLFHKKMFLTELTKLKYQCEFPSQISNNMCF